MNEKIDKINKLNRTIKDLEAFLSLLVESSTMSKYRKGVLHMFKIASYIWTGDDNVRKERDIDDRDTLKELSEVMIPVLSAKIEKLKLMLSDLIK